MMRQQRKFISLAVSAVVSHVTLEQEMHTASTTSHHITSLQQLAFLQDKGFWEPPARQTKITCDLSLPAPLAFCIASCTHQHTQVLKSAESRQICMSYVGAAGKHQCSKGSQSHSINFCYAHSLSWKVFLMLLKVLPWWQTPFSISIRMSCTFYP